MEGVVLRLPTGQRMPCSNLELFCRLWQLEPASALVERLGASQQAQAAIDTALRAFVGANTAYVRCAQPCTGRTGGHVLLRRCTRRRLLQLLCTAAERQGGAISDELVEALVASQVCSSRAAQQVQGGCCC